MRALFFLLVLANLLFYAWHAGYLGPGPQTAGEADRLSAQISPEAIRIISAEDARQLATGKPRPPACYEWGSFTAQDVERALVLLAAMNPPPKFSQRKVEETAGWWVFLPPQPNKPAADKKTAELKQLGITEFYVVNDDGPNKFAISLGVFKTEEGARNYLEIVLRQGVKTARIAERETRVSKTILHFGEVDDGLKARLTDLKREFSSLELRECTAEERKADALVEDKKG
jgi:hypothetical protein